MKSRRGFAIQRLMNAMRQAHADGWFIVFDTLTLADDRLEAFYDNPNALRDYFRDIGRMVLAAEGRKANDSHADCYQYFCVPEYGTANGRLHFHAVHFMRTLPTGSVDPNFGRRVRNRRQLNSLQNTWPYGYSMPIAVRYTQDAFSRSGWLWPVDAKGEPLKATSYMAVGFYVAKYVNKKSDMDLAAKGLGAKEWNNSLKTKLSLLPKKLFRIRMSRNFGMKMLTMTNLSTECLIQLTKLGYDATPFNQILKQNAKREMRLRLGKVTVADVLAAQPVTTNLLKFMRASIKMIGVSNLQSFIASMTQKLTLSDISDESKNYLDKAGITTACLRIKSKWTAEIGERFSRNAETDLVCRLLLEKKKRWVMHRKIGSDGKLRQAVLPERLEPSAWFRYSRPLQRTRGTPVQKSEIEKVQRYLRQTFGNHGISIEGRPNKDDSAEVSLDGEFIGVIFKDDEEGDVSYDFHMTILEMDLD